ncbi:MAG: PIN domain-containing protein [Candidatus Diapherotrites archaeon]
MKSEKGALVDAGIFLAALDVSEKEKREKALQFLLERKESGNNFVSVHSLLELSEILTENVRSPLSASQTREIILEISDAFQILPISPTTVARALEVMEKFEIPYSCALSLAVCEEHHVELFFGEGAEELRGAKQIRAVNPLK